MKTSFLILAAIISIHTSWAQLKTTPVCPVFVVDVLEGDVNKYSPKSTLGEIKKAFPCFTESVDVTTSSACAGVFYKNKDIYFYTDRNYIEIRQNFKGKLSLPLYVYDGSCQWPAIKIAQRKNADAVFFTGRWCTQLYTQL